MIGNYTYSSFSSKGIGRFKPQKGANPAVGEVEKAEEVGEERVEVVCPKNKAKEVTAAIRRVHPYEEVALDIYPLLSEEEL